MSLAQQHKTGSEDPIIDFNTAQPQNNAVYDTPPSSSDRDSKASPRDTGTLLVHDDGTRYIDSSNWRAILEEIKSVREVINDAAETPKDLSGGDPFDESSPALLLGTRRLMSKQELLTDLPQRSITDRLVSRFLKSSEPFLILLHVPTFRREYDQFWRDPHGMPFTWIAQLYAMIAISVCLHYRSGEPLPLLTADPMAIWDEFRQRAAQCLIHSNYITPGKYKVEALLLYSLSEFHRSQDALMSVHYLFGITIRLALRMGYHRDASFYPKLSPWEGEMRRRVWALLCQLDTLVAFQNGIPRSIQPWYSDTALPTNLLDEDFDQDTVQLPPGRPDEERSPSSYTRSKARLMGAFGLIVDLSFKREYTPYEEIMDLDRKLKEARDQLPGYLTIRPMAQSIGDQTHHILARYTQELLYQKSRIVLHRPYMAEQDSKYAFSRRSCIEAATETLRHHHDISNESLPGGQLYADRFMINSFQNTDFMLSSMILCLALSQDIAGTTNSDLGSPERREQVQLLMKTHRIFQQTQNRSADTQRAFAALDVMLRQLKGLNIATLTLDDTEIFTPTSGDVSSETITTLEQHPYATFPASGDLIPSAHDPHEETSLSSFGVIGDMLTTPAQVDWRLYDSHMFGYDMTSPNDIWPPFEDISTADMGFPMNPDQ
ncbi:hypothetical protein N7468_006790 [Penicillium chermesinum]|uniref:Xylanolytic transcriptional activator regulatory domain-containing protein n=1 Tax=Penicillium chermesinum TaxID=63820 RepID=A0A9W9NT10_9EURO|nr:uncharacterized protein N7468_006790 [Penicillium chermesinum]KAJ5225565.1 hypothetical protein N7468_006790 [Penicillium chermesinum]